MNIAIGYCFYNDLESIKRGLPELSKNFDYVFAVDGKFSFRDGSDFSTDDTIEFVKSFPNVIYEKFVGMEHDKRNKYLEMCERFEVDILIVIDSDEYIKEIDIKEFRKNIEKIKHKPYPIHGINYFTDNQYTSYPRIFCNPEKIRYWMTHNTILIDGSISRIQSSDVIEGITMAMDDSLRSEEYLNETIEYQKKMIEYERPYRKQAYGN